MGPFPHIGEKIRKRDEARLSVLRVIHSMSALGGGPGECVRQFSAALVSHGVETHVASLDAFGTSERADLPAGIKEITALGPGKGSYGYSPKLVPWLTQHAPQMDAVIIEGVWNYHSWGTWRALRSLNGRQAQPPPYWVYPHGMLDPWFRRTFPLKHLKKVIYWRLAESRVIRDAAGVVFSSDEECMLARQSFSPYRAREIVIPHGIRPPPGDPGQQKELFYQHWPELRGKRLLLYLGRLHPKKGPELAIQAFGDVLREMPSIERKKWVLVMAGPVAGTGVDSTYLESLRALSGQIRPNPGESNLSKLADSRPETQAWAPIVFPGMLQNDLKWGAIHASEAFVLPSHQENFGIAVAEALACGTPVLISDKVNIWREIAKDGAGLVDSDDRPGTTRLLQKWLAMPKERCEAMREQASQTFSARFEVQRATAALVEAIRAHLARG